MFSVYYRELVPMLLNEIQKLSTKVGKDRAERAPFEQRLSALESTLAVRAHKQMLEAALEMKEAAAALQTEEGLSWWRKALGALRSLFHRPRPPESPSAGGTPRR
jgi:hypothetical protein